MNILGNPRVLPDIKTEAQLLEARHMARVSQDEIALIEEDKIRQKQLYGIEPAQEVLRGEFVAIKQLEAKK